MGVIQGLNDELYWECINHVEKECVEPLKPHAILHRDHENAITLWAHLQNHEQAAQAGEEIENYLEKWADDEIFVIQLVPQVGVAGFIADIIMMGKENEEDRETEARREDGMEERTCNLDHAEYGPIKFEVPRHTSKEMPCPWHWEDGSFDRQAYEETLVQTTP